MKRRDKNDGWLSTLARLGWPRRQAGDAREARPLQIESLEDRSLFAITGTYTITSEGGAVGSAQTLTFSGGSASIAASEGDSISFSLTDTTKDTTFTISTNANSQLTSITNTAGTSSAAAAAAFKFTSLSADANSNSPIFGFSITAKDNNNVAADELETFGITLAPVNDAPVLGAAAPALPSIAEDVADAANTGQGVASLVGTTISDVDVLPASTPKSIAVTAVDNTNGVWKYSLDSGANWVAFTSTTGAVDLSGSGESGAVLLTENDLVRFVPKANYSGSATFDYRAWDQSDGKAHGARVVSPATGGANAYSVAKNTATVTVTPVADTPNVSPSSITVLEDTTSSVITVTRATGDTALYLKVTNVTGGSLSQTSGGPAIADGTFLDFSSGTVALYFTPTANSEAAGGFDLQASLTNTNAGLGGAVVPYTVTVTPVADAPVATPLTFSMPEDTTSGPIVVTWAPGDHSPYLKVSQTTGGTLSQTPGGAAIANGTFLDFTSGSLTFYFTPTANSNSPGSIRFRGSTTNDMSGQSAAFTTVNITVTPTGETPSIGPASMTTLEDTTSNAITVTRAGGDASGYLKVTGITNGTLSTSKSGAAIADGAFLSYSGPGTVTLYFTPTPNSEVAGTFNVQTSATNDDTGLGGLVVPYTVNVTPVADTPIVSPASPMTTLEDTTSGAITVTHAAEDNSGFLKVTGVSNGTLSLTSGGAAITNGTFLDFSSGTVTLYFTPTANSSATGDFNVQSSTTNTNAGLGGSVVAYTVNVTAVADTPSIAPASTTVLEDAVSSGAITVTRATGDTATHIKVTGISGGTLSLTAGGAAISNGSFLAYTLGAVTLYFTPTPNSEVAGTFSVQSSIGAADAGLGGAVVPYTVNVTAVADTPLVSPSSITTLEDTTTGAITVTHAAGDNSGFLKVTGISGGTLSQTSGGAAIANGTFLDFSSGTVTLYFTPTANSNTAGAFSVQSSTSNLDAGLGGSVVSKSITVTAVADTPTISPASISTVENTTTGPITVTQAAGDTATHIKVTGISGGTLSLTSGGAAIAEGAFLAFSSGVVTLYFTPTAGSDADGTFSVQASLSNSDAGLGGAVLANTVSVSAVADTPSISPASITTLEDTTTTAIQVIRAAGDTSTFFKVTGISGGTLSLTSGGAAIANGTFLSFGSGTVSLYFTPTPDSEGPGAFSVQASTTNADAGLGGSVVSGSITVTPVADTPSVSPASITTLEDTTSGAITVTRAAGDGSGFLKVTGISGGTLSQTPAGAAIVNGTFLDFSSGSITLYFRPTADSNASGAYSVQASTTNTDAGLGGSVVSGSITVTPVADTPTISPASTTTLEDTTSGAITVTRAAGDTATFLKVTGISGGTLSQTSGGAAIVNGTFLDFSSGTITLYFTPTPDSNATGAFNVQASVSNADAGLGGSVVSGSITVTPVADTPSVSPASITTLEDTTSGAITVTRAVGDSSGFLKVTGISGGTLSQTPGGTAIANGAFLDFSSGTITLYFTPTLDSNASGAYSVQASTTNTDTGLGGSVVSGSITVTPVADTPTISPASITTLEDTTSGAITVTRAVGDTATFLKVTGISGGTLSQTPGGTAIVNGTFLDFSSGTITLYFTPTPDSDATGSFSVQASVSNADAGLGGSVVSGSITVTPVADTPSISPASTTTPEDATTAAIQVIRAVGDSSPYFKVTGITGGTLSLTPGGTAIANGTFLSFGGGAVSLYFTPTLDSNAAGGFSVQASTTNADTGLGGSAVSCSIAVTPVADTPTVSSPTLTSLEDGQSGVVTVTRSVVDDATTGWFQVTEISNGKVYRQSDNTEVAEGDFVQFDGSGQAGLYFVPTADTNLTGTFNVRASTSNAADGSGLGGAKVGVSVAVTPIADTPSVSPASTTTNEDTPTGVITVTRAAVDGATTGWFQVTGITGGKVYRQSDNTEVAEGAFVQFNGSGQAGLYFVPAADSDAAGSFNVQASTTNGLPGLAGGVVGVSIAVTPIADTPSVSPASTTTNEDTPSGVVTVTRAAVDGATTGWFQVTGITGGKVYRQSDNTEVVEGGFVQFNGAGQAGVYFAPTADSNATGSFNVQASTSNSVAGLGGAKVGVTIAVTPIADTPSVSPTSTTTNEDTPTGVITVTRAAVDSATTGWFQVTGITGGKVYRQSDNTEVVEGGFVQFDGSGQAGVYFAPTADSNATGSFNVQASTSNSVAGLGGAKVGVTIAVTPIADTPTAAPNPIVVLEDTPSGAIVVTRASVDDATTLGFIVTGATNGYVSTTPGGTALANGAFVAFDASGQATLYFNPDLNTNLPGSFNVRATTTSNASGAGGAVVTVNITITPVNDQPVLTPGTVDLAPVLEDAAAPVGAVGTLVRDLVDIGGAHNNVADPDPGAVTGMAVVGADNGAGQWWYSLNGVTWSKILGVSDGNALLLAADADTRLYFQPNPDFNGPSGGLTFRAWDQTPFVNAGALTEGSVVNLTVEPFDAASPVSGVTAFAVEYVTPVNDAPVLDASQDQKFAPINENTPDALNIGQTVAQVIANGSISDVDLSNPAAAPEAIAVTSVDNTYGKWQYFLVGGSSWQDFSAGSGVQDLSSAAVLLDSGALVRFVPNLNYNGPSSITFRAWDQSGTETPGSTVDLSSAASVGGTTHFSSASDAITIQVQNVNNAPILDASKDQNFTNIPEDLPDGANVGQTVSGVLQPGSISEVPFDNAVVLAIAVTRVDNTYGRWQYMLSGGGGWLEFAAGTGVQDISNSAVLLDAGSKIRFAPNANFNGDSSIVFRAWDRTGPEQPGDRVDLSSPLSVGGITPFSAASDTIGLHVDSVNDPPILVDTSTVSLPTLQEDPTSNPGTKISDLLSASRFDEVPFDNAPVVAIVVTQVDNTFGSWQYSLDGGGSWRLFTATTGAPQNLAGASVFLDGNALVRFVPNANASGSATFRYQAWDENAGASGSLLQDGGGAVSVASALVQITVDPVADPPTVSPGTITTNEDTTTTDIIVNRSSVDGPEIPYVRVTGIANGTLEWLNGAVWQAVASGDFIPYNIGGQARFRFSPVPNSDVDGVFTVQSSKSADVTGLGGAAVLVPVTVVAVADPPLLVVPTGPVAGSEGSPTAINISAALTDTDGSETLSITITGVPANVTFNHGSMVSAGVWQFSPADLAGLTLTAADNEDFTLTVNATSTEANDPSTATTTGSILVQIANVNPTPTIVSGPSTANEGDPLQYTGQFTDPGASSDSVYQYQWVVTRAGDSYTYTSPASPAPTGTAPGASPASVPALNFTPPNEGVYSIVLRVRDKDMPPGAFVETLAQTLTVSNVAPTVTIVSGPAGGSHSPEGTTVVYTATFQDPGLSSDDDYAYVWTVERAAGAGTVVVAQTSGSTKYAAGVPQFQFTPPDDGLYTVTLTVTDNPNAPANLTGQASRTLVVDNVAPQASASTVVPAAGTVTEGGLFSIDYYFTDPGFTSSKAGTSETFSVTVDWGDGLSDTYTQADFKSLVQGSPGSPTQGRVTLSHRYADDAAGGYGVVVTVSDDDGGLLVQNFNAGIANSPPQLTSQVGNQVVNEGTLLDLAPLLRFTDLGFTQAPRQEVFYVDIDWGDGTKDLNVAVPAADVVQGTRIDGTTVTTTSGFVNASHVYADNLTGDAPFHVKVTLRDDDDDGKGSGSTSFNFDVVVHNVAPQVTVVGPTDGDEGSSVTFDGKFTDPGLGSDAQYSYVWSVAASNGQIVPTAAPAKLSLPGDTSSLTFTPFDNGVYTITLKVTDKDGAVGTKVFTFTSHNVDPTASVSSSPPPASLVEGNTLTFGLSGTDVGSNDVLTYDYKLYFLGADGKAPQILVEAGALAGVPASGKAFGYTFTPPDDGYFRLDFTVVDDDGGKSVDTVTFQIANAAPTIGSMPASFSGIPEGGIGVLFLLPFTDPGFNSALLGTTETFKVHVNWGDGTIESFDVPSYSVAQGGPGTLTQGDVLMSHVYADNGSYKATFQIGDDDGGLSAVTSITMDVVNVAPTFFPGLEQGLTFVQGDVVTIFIPFYDPGFKTESWTVTLDYGGLQSLLVSHPTIYRDPADPNQPAGILAAVDVQQFFLFGQYSITATVRDDDGGVATIVIPVSIIENPNFRFDIPKIESTTLTLPPVAPAVAPQTVQTLQQSSDVSNESRGGSRSSPPPKKFDMIANIRLMLRVDRLKSFRGAVEKVELNDVLSSADLMVYRDKLSKLGHGVFRITLSSEGVEAQTQEIELTQDNSSKAWRLLDSLMRRLESQFDPEQEIQNLIPIPGTTHMDVPSRERRVGEEGLRVGDLQLGPVGPAGAPLPSAPSEGVQQAERETGRKVSALDPTESGLGDGRLFDGATVRSAALAAIAATWAGRRSTGVVPRRGRNSTSGAGETLRDDASDDLDAFYDWLGRHGG